MLKRKAKKVKDAAKATQFLRLDRVLQENNYPRGSCLKEYLFYF